MNVYREFLSHSPLLVLPLAALLIFLTVFLVVVGRTMVRRQADYDRVAALPFGEESHERL